MKESRKKNDTACKASVCIVIPAYKNFSDLNAYEVISITQCCKVLHRYPVFFVGPESVDWSGYNRFCTGNNFSCTVKKFPGHFFEGLAGYNTLMMNTDFYLSFNEFEYMLIYQTDCFVFRDELSEWCRRGDDYTGAPWIGINISEWFRASWYPSKLVYMYKLSKHLFVHHAGNGGFSLRKISSIVSNLKRFHKAAEKWQAYEDGFYSHYVGTFNPFFHIPDVKTALTFSFDANPEMAFRLNRNKLPFGCHAWFREKELYYENNLSFWEPIIKTHMA